MKFIQIILSYFACYFRPLFLLKFFKFFKNNFIAEKIISVYDPNNIRKKITKKLNNKFIRFFKKKLIFELNINDHIGYNFFINEKWNDLPIKLANQISFTENDIFIDIGANTGLVSIPFADKFNCHVIAIEASRQNGKFLKKNIKNNNLNIKPIIKFLSSDKLNDETKPNNDWVGEAILLPQSPGAKWWRGSKSSKRRNKNKKKGAQLSENYKDETEIGIEEKEWEIEEVELDSVETEKEK